MISVEVVPHDCQRYNTVGDWQFDSSDKLLVNVSDTGDPVFNFLVAIHEIVEATLCRLEGITDEQVTEWDKNHIDDLDPGGIPSCPYRLEHMIASFIEVGLAQRMGIDWNEYEAAIEVLVNNYQKA